jgi:hypothetical protein
MTSFSSFDLSHFRLLWLIYNSSTGLTGRELVDELVARGWCDPGILLSRPRAPSNQP